jgi:hypothetical protein
LAACFARGERMLGDVELTGKRVATSVAMVHEPGHPEPWIIALSEPPTVHRAFDYGLTTHQFSHALHNGGGGASRCRRA